MKAGMYKASMTGHEAREAGWRCADRHARGDISYVDLCYAVRYAHPVWISMAELVACFRAGFVARRNGL